MIGALLGRHFWIPASLALAAGFWLPGDYGGLRWSVTIVLGAILFFSCLNVRLDHVWRETQKPELLRMLGLLTFVKLLVLPIGAWLMTMVIAPAWAPGILLVSAMPAGLTSIAFADLNRGNQVLALMLVLVTSLICPLTIPMLLDWLGTPGGHLGISALADRALYIVAVLLAPFILAQLVRRVAARQVDLRPLWWTRSAILCSCILVFVSVAINRAAWVSWQAWQFVAPLGLAVAASALFAAVAWMLRTRLEDEDAIAFACGSLYMNNGLSVVLAVRFFPNNGYVLLPAVLMQLPMMLTMAILARVRHEPLRQTPP